MVFDWKEFYDVGVHLEEHSSEEAYQRSAVSRYYYSCYHLVKNYFERKFHYLGRPEHPHKTLIERLKFYGDEDENDLADALSQLRVYRTHADYKPNFRKNTLRKAKKTTKDIFSLLQSLEN